jgi:hypothetical protein
MDERSSVMAIGNVNPGRDDVKRDRDRDANPDPITGSPGSHPIGTGVGAAGGGAAGAAAGAAIGAAMSGPAAPVGGVVGAVVGAVAGGLAGKAAGEAINPTEEDAYWRANYRSREYVQPGADYDQYEPAYRYGYSSYTQYQGRTWDQVEPDLRRDWDRHRGTRSDLDWDRARPATRDAWQRVKDRVERAVPGDSDRDGK